jgi:D-amino-acid dehydrogenase
VLGPAKIGGLHLNCGHGSTGWAMACGSSKLVADIIAGRAPEISMDGLTMQRYL